MPIVSPLVISNEISDKSRTVVTVTKYTKNPKTRFTLNLKKIKKHRECQCYCVSLISVHEEILTIPATKPRTYLPVQSELITQLKVANRRRSFLSF